LTDQDTFVAQNLSLKIARLVEEVFSGVLVFQIFSERK
jgi:hypothetical protein